MRALHVVAEQGSRDGVKLDLYLGGTALLAPDDLCARLLDGL